MDRDRLEHIRDALASGPISAARGDKRPALEGRLFEKDMDTDDRIALFAGRCTSSGGEVHFAEGPEALERLLDALLEDGSRVAIAGAQSLADRLGIDLSTLLPRSCEGTKAGELEQDELFNLDTAITGTELGIAETGSLLLFSEGDGARLASLVPENHIALLWPDQIVPDLLDAAAFLKKMGTGGHPGGMTLISGPSKTADIELSLVVGVHGPARLHVIIMGREPENR